MASLYKLLLVDDEANTREALSSYFPWHEVGFEVVGQAGNGKEALNFINREPVDVVLTDIKMPVMSGIDLAETLYKEKRDTMVVFISGYREFEYAQKALHYKVKNYIVKPVKYQMLFDVFCQIRTELDEVKGQGKAESEELSGNRDEGLIISKVKWYIRHQYRTATLEEAARLVHLNSNYLSQLFKQKTGMNFLDYLIQVKMEAARKLLQDPRYKTYEISEAVGYSNAKNFTRAFKNVYGCTPSEFRKMVSHYEEKVLH